MAMAMEGSFDELSRSQPAQDIDETIFSKPSDDDNEVYDAIQATLKDAVTMQNIAQYELVRNFQ